MSYPHRPGQPGMPVRLDDVRNAKAALSEPDARPSARPWTVTRRDRPLRALPPTRRYEMLWLDGDGGLSDQVRVAPALPAFEAAFSAFARGALIGTTRGEIAIEDLVPGMTVRTRKGPRMVRWVGRILLPPANFRHEGSPELFRVSADAFGASRAMPDLVLGSHARVLHRSARIEAASGRAEVLVPVADFVDGDQILKISPVSSTTAYHVILDEHAVMEVNGLPMESFHPGLRPAEGIQGEMLRLYMSLFPFLDSYADFGPMALPRMGLEAIGALPAMV